MNDAGFMQFKIIYLSSNLLCSVAAFWVAVLATRVYMRKTELVPNSWMMLPAIVWMFSMSALHMCLAARQALPTLVVMSIHTFSALLMLGCMRAVFWDIINAPGYAAMKQTSDVMSIAVAKTAFKLVERTKELKEKTERHEQ